MTTLIRLFKSYFLSEKPTGSTIADIELDLHPSISLKRLKEYKLTRNDLLHYTTVTVFLSIALIMNPAGIFAKLLTLSLSALLLLVPFTSQFFLNALPVLAWVFFYFNSRVIPKEYRPPISVKVLPAIETILYGDNLSQLLATSTAPFLDILAWIPYGLLHFSLPFVVATLLFLWGPPTSLRSFAFAFGYMNLTGVVVQLIFPAAAPWYKILHGLDPANYSMLGSPGGLARIDTLLNLDLYTTSFSKTSPLIFGAFPSLHSGCASMDALFLSYLFPKFTPFFVSYVLWLWWSTMYLTHHYFVDVIAGSCLAFSFFLYTKYKHLPINDLNCKNRWSYSEIKKYNMHKSDPLSTQLDDDLENQVLNPFENGTETQPSVPVITIRTQQTRARSNSVRPTITSPTGTELSMVSRSRLGNPQMSASLPMIIGADDSDSSPESTVFDSDIPRSVSRSSNMSGTSVESQFDLSVPLINLNSGHNGGKSRKD